MSFTKYPQRDHPEEHFLFTCVIGIYKKAALLKGGLVHDGHNDIKNEVMYWQSVKMRQSDECR